MLEAFTEPARFYWSQTQNRPGCPPWLEENAPWKEASFLAS